MKVQRKIRRPEAAAYIGVSPRTLEQLAVTGGGPAFYKIGRAVVYDTAELDQWLAERRRMSTSDTGREWK